MLLAFDEADADADAAEEDEAAPPPPIWAANRLCLSKISRSLAELMAESQAAADTHEVAIWKMQY